MTIVSLAQEPAARRAPQRGARRRKWRGIALGVSIVLHGGFALLVFYSLPTGAFIGGAGAAGGDGAAIVVSLAGPIGRKGQSDDTDQQAAETAARLEAMADKAHADQPSADPEPDPPKAKPKTDLAALFQEITQAHAASAAERAEQQAKDARKAKAGQGDGGSEARSDKAKGPQAKAKDVEGETDQPGDKGKATGDMWDQIETCWRPDSPVPVTLEVVVDTAGQLAIPPRILRPDGARLDELRLRAEAKAVQAVAACAPYRRGAPLAGRKTYRFAFVGRR